MEQLLETKKPFKRELMDGEGQYKKDKIVGKILNRDYSQLPFLSYFITDLINSSRLAEIFRLHSPNFVCFRQLEPVSIETTKLFFRLVEKIGNRFNFQPVKILHFRSIKGVGSTEPLGKKQNRDLFQVEPRKGQFGGREKFLKIILEFEDLVDGFHLSSSQLEWINPLSEEFPKKIFIASTHSLSEVATASKAHLILFSPIFDSKGRKGVGIKFLENVGKLHNGVMGLGGINSPARIALLKKSSAVGFGSISYFYRRPEGEFKNRGNGLE